MTQLQKSVASPPLTPDQVTTVRIGNVAALVIGLVMITAFAVALTFVLNSQPGPAAPAAQQGEAIDGWLPGITAANEARRIQEAKATIDGYLPALTSANEARRLQQSNGVVDSWMFGSAAGDDD